MERKSYISPGPSIKNTKHSPAVATPLSDAEKSRILRRDVSVAERGSIINDNFNYSTDYNIHSPNTLPPYLLEIIDNIENFMKKGPRSKESIKIFLNQLKDSFDHGYTFTQKEIYDIFNDMYPDNTPITGGKYKPKKSKSKKKSKKRSNKKSYKKSNKKSKKMSKRK